MGLSGNLETFLLTSIMQLLHNDRKTGILKVKSAGHWADVIFQEGTIVYAMSSSRHFRLGNLLLSRGVISKEQLEQCLEEGKQKKQALGKVLVLNGLVSIKVLEQFIRRQVEEIIYGLFHWECGDFEYSDSQLDLSGIVVTNLDVLSVLLEASRRIDEMEVLKKRIPSGELVFKIVEDTQVSGEIKLNNAEWSILSLIDGRSTVEVIVHKSQQDKLKVYKILYSLLSSGLIEKREILTTGNFEQTPRQTDVNYSALITGYTNILQIIWQNLEPEIGKETDVVFEECKPDSIAGQKELLRHFNPNNPATANMFTVEDNLKQFKTLSNAKEFLVQSFNRFIFNILERSLEILGSEHTMSMLKEIEKVIPHVTRYLNELKVENSIIEDIKKIVDRVQQSSVAAKTSKPKSGNLLSMLKKK